MIDAQERIKELEAKVEDLTKKLKKAKEESKIAFDIQDKFIKNSVHEIHTPLSIIITNKDLIKMKYGDIKFLNSIEAACKVIQNSYEDMAYHANMDKRDMSSKTIDLIEFLKGRCEYFDSIALANEVSLELKTDFQAIFVKIPEPKLQRLVDNNIANAIKYAKIATEVLVSVEVKDKQLLLEFTNFGRVISDKKAIFKRYHREDEMKSGFGIGLSLVYDICKNERIGVKLTSTAKSGTIFAYSFKSFELQR